MAVTIRLVETDGIAQLQRYGNHPRVQHHTLNFTKNHQPGRITNPSSITHRLQPSHTLRQPSKQVVTTTARPSRPQDSS